MWSLTPDETTAILLSLKVAGVATLAMLPLGVALAWLLARRHFWGKTLLNGIVHLPLVLPPVVTGYLLLLAFGRRGFAGVFFDQCCGLVFSFRWTGAALAAAVMGLPLMVRAIRLTIESVDVRLESAAIDLLLEIIHFDQSIRRCRMAFRETGHTDPETAAIGMRGGFVEFANELHQIDRVLKRIGRFVIGNSTRPIASERENISDGRVCVSKQNRLDLFLPVTDAG